MKKYHVNDRDRRLTRKQSGHQKLMKNLRELAKNPPATKRKEE